MEHYIFVDTERDKWDRLIEIGIAVFNESGVMVSSYNSYIRHKIGIEESLSPKIQAVTGIAAKDLYTAPKAREVLTGINIFLRKYIKKKKDGVTMYCWGDDRGYIERFYSKSSLENNIKVNVEDCQPFVMKNIVERPKSLSDLVPPPVRLVKLCKIFNIPFKQYHRAVDDAIYLGFCYFESISTRETKRYKYTSAYNENSLYLKHTNVEDMENIEEFFEFSQTKFEPVKEESKRKFYKKVLDSYRDQNEFYLKNKEELYYINNIIFAMFQESVYINKLPEYKEHQEIFTRLLDHRYYWDVFGDTYLNIEYYTELLENISKIIPLLGIVWEGVREEYRIKKITNTLQKLENRLRDMISKNTPSQIEYNR